MIDDGGPEKILRSWAKAYRESPEHRFPSDPHAEFFPVDMETAAAEIEGLRLEHQHACQEISVAVAERDALVKALIEAAERLEARGHKFGAREAWRILSDVGGSVRD